MSDTFPLKYTRDDFRSDQVVRWCPGCGDYSILAQVQRVMPRICAETQTPRENIVFISGIGCSSRFPYYMDTYGFHSIHGRAPALALGLKIARPEMQVWVITGDGDGLSIGGNHLIHAIRRNIDVKILLFNNRIYGLTKGQYSPTSEIGKKTKSSPYGVIAQPVNALGLALASRATFIARTLDTDSKHLQEVLLRAAHHRGTAFVEILQNCNIFNDGAFDDIKARDVRDDRLLFLEHEKPMRFGAGGSKVLIPSGAAHDTHFAAVAEAGHGMDRALVHDEASENEGFMYALANMDYPEFPVPMGVLRAVEQATYEDLVEHQIEEARERQGPGDLQALLDAGECWTVE
ncbi:MAG: 2-oxoacid:ferredoxin oxidoreductase subunit beta [Chromatiales bacterium]|jgi:2-oxoglutarate ferredoxin oxidoreductase subunit beta|nr:2-oxoacid:ferredoxin oxidoreductase subunit beta [Chromatiales bacterium]